MIDALQQRIAALEKRVGPQALSPLFAQLAFLYIERKRSEDALRICDAGLAHFPFYTTGHFIKGKALLALNMQAEARREFEFVRDFLPNNETIAGLLSQSVSGEEVTVAAAPQKVLTRINAPEPQKTPAPPQSPTPLPQPEPAHAIEAPQETTFFEPAAQTAPVSLTENAFGLDQGKQFTESPAVQEPTPFGDFNLPSTETSLSSETLQPPVEQPAGFDFGSTGSDLGFPAPIAPPEEEPFEQYADRRKTELSGENTVSLDDYLANRTPAPSPEPTPPLSFGGPDKIEELTQKLQSAERITPVINFAQKETTTASEQDTPAGMGFVTPTLAEIYAKQGWFDDAIKAYKTLARSKPADRERFEKRIAELEELKKQQAPG